MTLTKALLVNINFEELAINTFLIKQIINQGGKRGNQYTLITLKITDVGRKV